MKIDEMYKTLINMGFDWTVKEITKLNIKSIMKNSVSIELYGNMVEVTTDDLSDICVVLNNEIVHKKNRFIHSYNCIETFKFIKNLIRQIKLENILDKH